MVACSLVFSLSVHEFAHAYIADKLGDSTSRYLGRLTLNPLAHLDPLGMLMLLIIGIGWGKPVPFNPGNLANPKRDSAIIAFAGPASNFILAVIFSVLFRTVGTIPLVSLFLYLTVFYNLLLGIFNLLPIHPLDGFKIVYGLLPGNLAIQWLQTQSFGVVILIIMLLTNSFGRIVGVFIDLALNFLRVY